MKKLFSTLLVVLFATSLMAQTGLTCEDPIPVDSNYNAYVTVDPEEGYKEVWYTAGTYDLPLNVHFIPDNPNSDWGPDVTIDLTCTPGVYDDPMIDSLINLVNNFDLSFPVELTCGKSDNDIVEWNLSVESFYRDQLAEFGVTYNVKAFVKVAFYESGTIRLQPDPVFTNCIDNSELVVLDQEIAILPNDSSRVFTMPYTDWQNDSIQFVWTGNAPATIWLATGECDFLPSTASGYVCAHYNLEPGVPYRVPNKDITDLITANTGGGIFFAKVLSTSEGTLLTEKIPMSEIQGGATLLEYGQSVTVANANDLFCFPKNWGASMFVAATTKQVKMYVSHSADFTASAEDANVVGVAPFGLENNACALYLSSTELNAYKSGLTEDYLYVRFESETPVTITPDMWSASVCADASTLITPNTTYILAPRSGNTIFRMRYADFEGYPIDIEWYGSGSLPVYIADTCHYVLAQSNEHVLKYYSIRNGRTATVDAATLASWESRAEDGYFYVRFNPSNDGDVTFWTEKPAEEPVVLEPIYTTESAAVCFGETYDWNGKTYTETGKYTYTTIAANGADSIVTLNLTVYPQTPATTEEATIDFGTTYEWNGQTYSAAGEYTTTLQDENGCDYQATLILTILPEEQPETDGTILLNPTDELTINLDSAINVYHTEYDVWSAAKVQLNWYGDKPLHVFVAKDREFLVAIYHEDVVLYEKIEAVDPANGEPQVLVLDMSALRAYVNDGKLYVRFLTDADARLVIAPLTE